VSAATPVVAGHRGSAILLALFMLLLLEVLVAGLFWTLRVEARAGLESLAGARAVVASEAALVAARDLVERTPPESVEVVLARMPPPVRLPGRAVGYAELTRIDTALVEVLAQGLAGSEGVSARRQACMLFHLVRVADSTGAGSVRLVPVPERSVTNC
jgi:Tfp pilus assembly protein PilX